MNKQQLEDIEEVGKILGQAFFKETTILVERERNKRLDKFVKALNELKDELTRPAVVAEVKPHKSRSKRSAEKQLESGDVNLGEGREVFSPEH